MREKTYLRSPGWYEVDPVAGAVNTFAALSSASTRSRANATPLLLLIAEGAAPTEVLASESLVPWAQSGADLKVLIAVSAVEKTKILTAAQRRFEPRRLWFSAPPQSAVNPVLQAAGFIPNKRYEKKLCIYDYRESLAELAGVDLSELEFMVSVNCSRKMNAVVVPGAFVRLSQASGRGLGLSILNERFTWTED